MPKLSTEVMEERRGRIEDAAKELFIKRGFHATSMRDIATGAGTSLGNLYNYYRTKEDILESIIAKYQKVIDARLRAIFDGVEEPFHPDSLTRFGRMVKELVSAHADFWLLMYIDVLEFENRHFRRMFEGLASSLRRRFAPHFAELKRSGALYDGVDPAVGFTAAYMQFFNYFLVEKLFGGRRHLGLSDDQVVTHLTEIFCRGVLRPERLAELRASAPRARAGGSRARAPRSKPKQD
ncbi:MAG TPA: TetR/AcrR family transcriptional regulator [Pyrinomonadaceae bacterium]|nr:TetR/AcrR family transcriptional regulator [Pyrinomonadaceae bacterium]